MSFDKENRRTVGLLEVNDTGLITLIVVKLL